MFRGEKARRAARFELHPPDPWGAISVDPQELTTELLCQERRPTDEKAVDTDLLADAGVCRRLQDVLFVATGSRSARPADRADVCPTLRRTL